MSRSRVTNLLQPTKVKRLMSDFTEAVNLAITVLKQIRDTTDRPPRANREAINRLHRAKPSLREITVDLRPNDKRARLAPLRERVAICRLCSHLASSRSQTVFGVGNVDAETLAEKAGPSVCGAPVAVVRRAQRRANDR